MKNLIYGLVISVFLGAELLAVPLGVAQLSIYRIMLLLIGTVTFIKFWKKDPGMEISISDRINFYQLVYIMWFIYAVISVLWVESLSRWVFGVFFVGTGTASILFITFFLRTREDIKKLFYIFLGMTAFHQILGWYEVLTRNYLWGYNRFGAPITTFGNINDYATLLLAGIFISILIWLITSEHWVRFYCIIHIISGILLLQRSGSRGNQLALILGCVVFLLVKLLSLKVSRKIFLIFGGFSIIFVTLFILLPPVRNFTMDTISLISSTLFRQGGSNRYRINLILNGFGFLLQTYGFGVGAGNIEYWMENRPIFTDIDAFNIHNWFMEILTGYGILVFLLYTIMYVYILRQLYMNYKYNDDLFIKNTSLVLFAYLIAFIVSSISSASNIFIEWQWVFWGIIITFVKYSEKSIYYEYT